MCERRGLAGMNQAERIVYGWLCQHYEPEQITYQPRWSPDFLTVDGRGWEAKLSMGPHGRSITVHPRQWMTLRERQQNDMLDELVVVNHDGQIDARIPLSELTDPPSRWQSFRLTMLAQ